jgi:SAM-dependent methyltransferase
VTTFYGEDLAVIHDEGFGAVARRAAVVIREVLESLQSVPGPLVDIGRGSGVLQEALGEIERDQIGLDRSPDLINIARRRAPHAHFHVGTLDDFEFPAACLVSAVSEVVNYIRSSLTEPPFLFRLIDKAAAALPVGGYFVFDAAGPGRVPNGRSRGFVETEQWACLFAAEESAEPPALIREITTFRRIGDHYRRDHETHLQRLWAPDEVEHYLAQRGFEVRRSSDYAGLALPANSYNYIARKVA